MKLLLVRHGYTESFEQGITGGSIDTLVSEKGKEMLREDKKNNVYPETDYYYTTDLTRTIQTMEILFSEKVSSGKLVGMREHDMGDFENQPLREDREIYSCWLEDKSDYHEELFTPFQKRVMDTVEMLYDKHSDKSVTVVCHAGVIRAVLMYLNHIKPTDYFTLHIYNGNGYYMDVRKENGILVSNGYEVIGRQ